MGLCWLSSCKFTPQAGCAAWRASFKISLGIHVGFHLGFHDDDDDDDDDDDYDGGDDDDDDHDDDVHDDDVHDDDDVDEMNRNEGGFFCHPSHQMEDTENPTKHWRCSVKMHFPGQHIRPGRKFV